LQFPLTSVIDHKMANSPVVLPGSADKSAANRTKFSNNAAASNGATPEASNTNNGAGVDLAEQMNEEEKRKYVKGRT
jgi:cyclin-dependent kinase 7